MIIPPIEFISGTVKVPASKSYSQRALAAAFLAKGKSKCVNFGHSDDELAALSILKTAGALCHQNDHILEVDASNILDKELIINCGESGLSARLFTPIFANYHLPIQIVGEGSLRYRSMKEFENIFKQLNVDFHSNNGVLPFHLKGPIDSPSKITVNGEISSQFITGLVFILSAIEKQEDIVVEILNPTSIPYILMSLEVLKSFGASLEFIENKIVVPKNCRLVPSDFSIESDWSSASYWIVAAAIGGKISLEGLNPDSLQADKQILDVLGQYGANYSFNNECLVVEARNHLPINFDATNCPDLFPALVVLATSAHGISEIHGVNRLFHKESDRAKVLVSEFSKLGSDISIIDNSMIVNGKGKLNGGIVESHNDHRISMACSIAAMNSRKPIFINGSDSVKKSYPDFFKHLAGFGVKIGKQNEM